MSSTKNSSAFAVVKSTAASQSNEFSQTKKDAKRKKSKLKIKKSKKKKQEFKPKTRQCILRLVESSIVISDDDSDSCVIVNQPEDDNRKKKKKDRKKKNKPKTDSNLEVNNGSCVIVENIIDKDNITSKEPNELKPESTPDVNSASKVDEKSQSKRKVSDTDFMQPHLVKKKKRGRHKHKLKVEKMLPSKRKGSENGINLPVSEKRLKTDMNTQESLNVSEESEIAKDIMASAEESDKYNVSKVDEKSQSERKVSDTDSMQPRLVKKKKSGKHNLKVVKMLPVKRKRSENDINLPVSEKWVKTDINSQDNLNVIEELEIAKDIMASAEESDKSPATWGRMGNVPTESGIMKTLLQLSGSVETETEKFQNGEGFDQSEPVAITTKSGVLVVVKHPSLIPLKGRVKAEVLIGEASILGYRLSPGNGCHDIFSPSCNSYTTVTTLEGQSDAKNSIELISSRLDTIDISTSKKLIHALQCKTPFVVLKLSPLITSLCSHISRFMPFANLFKVVGDKSAWNKQLIPLDVAIPQETEDFPWISLTEDLQATVDLWIETILQDHEEQPVIVVCGGKDSGKSTTNRVLVNSTLNKLDSVYYLECDVGQTEFTPPGVVSLVKVTSPLLGPPFTHQRKSICSYHFGGVTPTVNPDLYMHCVSLCVEAYRHQDTSGPLVVNTMGWMKGLGWQLLLDTIRIVSPAIIVQLTSHQLSNNIAPLTVEALTDTSWTDLSQMYQGPVVPEHLSREPRLVHLNVPVSTNYKFKMKSTDYRDLSILSHLGNGLETGLTLYSVTPYIVHWKDVAVHICHGGVPMQQIMYALNASLVALCETDISEAEKLGEDGPLFLRRNFPLRWIGYGVIRGIDMERKLFYVITSLSDEDLSRVNVLSKGGVTIPETLLTSQKFEQIPYVDEIVESVGISAVRPRKHMPRKSSRGFTR